VHEAIYVKRVDVPCQTARWHNPGRSPVVTCHKLAQAAYLEDNAPDRQRCRARGATHHVTAITNSLYYKGQTAFGAGPYRQHTKSNSAGLPRPRKVGPMFAM